MRGAALRVDVTTYPALDTLRLVLVGIIFSPFNGITEKYQMMPPRREQHSSVLKIREGDYGEMKKTETRSKSRRVGRYAVV